MFFYLITEDLGFHLLQTFFHRLEKIILCSGDVKLMVDAIESSKYLSEKKTLKLIEALQKLCPETQVRDMKSQLVVFDRVKSMNEDIHESLGKISSAIA